VAARLLARIGRRRLDHVASTNDSALTLIGWLWSLMILRRASRPRVVAPTAVDHRLRRLAERCQRGGRPTVALVSLQSVTLLLVRLLAVVATASQTLGELLLRRRRRRAEHQPMVLLVLIQEPELRLQQLVTVRVRLESLISVSGEWPVGRPQMAAQAQQVCPVHESRRSFIQVLVVADGHQVALGDFFVKSFVRWWTGPGQGFRGERFTQLGAGASNKNMGQRTTGALLH
jgi:hypothetical protein